VALELVHDSDALPPEDQAVLDWLEMMDRIDPDGLLLGCFLAPELVTDGGMQRMRVSCHIHGEGCWVVVPVGSIEPASLLALAESVGPQCGQ
jgi:hypothetical protein